MKERVFDKSVELADNAMLRHRRELFYEWSFELNDRLGLDIYRVTYGSHTVAWWNCPNCYSIYDMEICSRKRQNCPYCRGSRVNHTNSLASLYSEVAAEWHPTKNGNLSPHDVTSKSGKEVFWLGECGHEWDMVISTRTGMDCGCPICDNKRILIGFNDMWTTNPELAELLASLEDGYKYTQSSGRRVDWKCIECDEKIKNKGINDIKKRGLSCPRCSDGVKFPEKFMYNLLNVFSINFIFDSSQKWSQGKRYDFYLPEHNIIIETHGEQHTAKDFEGLGGRTIGQEQENDRFKEQLAKENGIDKYIVIDCRHSTVKWIKENIMGSELVDIIDLNSLDWEEIGRLASDSLIRKACDLWNDGMRNTTEIGIHMKLSSATIRNYLKRGVEIGWCDYCPREAISVISRQNGINYTRRIIQMSRGGIFFKEWKSIKDASETLVIDRNNITGVCRGRHKTAGGFKWMYKEDYDKELDKIEI